MVSTMRVYCARGNSTFLSFLSSVAIHLHRFPLIFKIAYCGGGCHWLCSGVMSNMNVLFLLPHLIQSNVMKSTMFLFSLRGVSSRVCLVSSPGWAGTSFMDLQTPSPRVRPTRNALQQWQEHQAVQRCTSTAIMRIFGRRVLLGDASRTFQI